MKKYIYLSATLALLLAATPVLAAISTVPWLQNSTTHTLYTPYPNNATGVNITTPGSALEVQATSTATTGNAFIVWDSALRNLFTIRNDGNVGVGSTTPWGQLSVNPNGVVGPEFVVGSSTATNFVITNAGASVFGRSSIKTAGDVFEVLSSPVGGVGLGVSSDQSGYTASCWGVGASQVCGSAQLYVLDGTGSRVAARIDGGSTQSAHYLDINSNGTSGGTIFNIDSSGNVGIGTSSPGTILSIQGVANFASATTTFLGSNLTSTSTNWIIGVSPPPQTTSSAAGGNLVLYAGTATVGSTGNTAAQGGDVNITAGNAVRNAGGSAARGGDINITAGQNIGNNIRSGNVTISSGPSNGNLNGVVTIIGGTSSQPGTIPGGAINVTTGAGNIQGQDSSTAGPGGALTLSSGVGGNETGNGTGGTGGASGLVTIASGVGGNATGVGTTNIGGASANVLIQTGAGGNATGATNKTGGNSGNVLIQTGAAGTGATANGTVGTISLGTNLATNDLFINTTHNVGVGSTTPWAKLSVHANNGDTNPYLFAIGSSTASATTTLFSVDNQGQTTAGNINFTSALLPTNGWYLSGTNQLSMALNGLIQSTFTTGGNVSFNGNITSGGTFRGAGILTQGNDATLNIQGRTFGNSSGSEAAANFNAIVNQTGTAGVTVLQVAPTINTLGSGNNFTLDVQGTTTATGSTASASKFNVGIKGNVGIGSTTPGALVAIHANNGDSNTTLFAIGSSTATATTTLFSVGNTGHIMGSSTSPTLSSCGTNPTVNGDDTHGYVTVGSVSATGCTITFAAPFPARPMCQVVNETMSLTSAFGYSVTGSAITVTQATGLVGDVLDYSCRGF